MLSILNKCAALIVFFMVSFISLANDSLKVGSFNSVQLLQLTNQWLNTGNVGGLVFNNTFKLVSADLSMDFQNSDFHLLREPAKKNSYTFNTYSYFSIDNRWFLYGKFGYSNTDEKGARWNGTYEPYSGCPYILADSVTGVNFHKEQYKLAGAVGYRLNDQISIGCKLDYLAGIGAKQKDPRPKNTVVQYLFAPGIILSNQNYKLGFDIGVYSRIEEIDYEQTISDNSDITYFAFKGFGFYNKLIGMDYFRFQSSKDYFAGIQYEKNLKKLATLSELRVVYSLTEVEDGSSIVRKKDGGDWGTFKANLNEQLKLVCGKTIHQIQITGGFFEGKGKEYLQNLVHTGKADEYVTISKSLKMKKQTADGTVQYNYFKMKDKKQVDLHASALVNFIYNSEKYYYIPEIFTSNYTNITGAVSVQKNIYAGRIHYAPELNIEYKSNLDNSFLLSNLPEITSKQRPETYLQEFNYATTDLLKVGVRLHIGYSPRNQKLFDQVFFQLYTGYWKPSSGENGFALYNTKLGFIF